MLQASSAIVVAIIGLYFVGLGIVAIFAPVKAQKFLLGFAETPAKHFSELAIRFIAGGSLLVFAPRSRSPEAFSVFGWILLVTTLGLLLIPWRWHEKFARKAVPAALPYLRVIGICSLALGAALFYSMTTPR
jgi:uncharacterized protein YjeT (DUF2065 family)